MSTARTMVMRSPIMILILGASLAAAPACATKSGTGTAVGAVGGAAVGGLVGGSTGALIGAFAGGALGYGVGRKMEEDDKRQMAYAMEHNRRREWENSQGDRYRVSPTKTFHSNGRQCRNFRMVADVDGRPEEVHGTACKNRDGSWDMEG